MLLIGRMPDSRSLIWSQYGDDAIVLFVIHKSGQVEICSAESSIEPTPGQTLISLVDEV